jgi:hypothetical protein
MINFLNKIKKYKMGFFFSKINNHPTSGCIGIKLFMYEDTNNNKQDDKKY